MGTLGTSVRNLALAVGIVSSTAGCAAFYDEIDPERCRAYNADGEFIIPDAYPIGEVEVAYRTDSEQTQKTLGSIIVRGSRYELNLPDVPANTNLQPLEDISNAALTIERPLWGVVGLSKACVYPVRDSLSAHLP